MYSTAGTFVYPVPSGTTQLMVQLKGGGGGGVGSTYGGNEGDFAEVLVDVTGMTSLTIEVGAGGAPGSNGGASEIKSGSATLATVPGGAFGQGGSQGVPVVTAPAVGVYWSYGLAGQNTGGPTGFAGSGGAPGSAGSDGAVIVQPLN